jgi:D-alanine-D-alanine ligase
MIEINTIPGMSGGSIVPKQIKAAGMTMTEVLTLIIEDELCNQ